MRISTNFNAFMHGVVLKQFSAFRYIKLYELKIAFHPFYLTVSTLKQLLKWLDSDYPRDKAGVPLSYKKLEASDFLSHIAFLEQLAAQNGYLLDFTKDLR